jgi:two-component system, chemotaxis family, chemotaxis protein CheY
MAKIMICDDSMFMRMQLKSILEKAGHKVIIEAVDGMDAIEQYKVFHNDIDLVTMDITMPKLDGVGALRLIKSEFPDAKIIMLSAAGMEDKIIECAKLGIENFIRKPYKDTILLNAVNIVLDKYGIK